ncbi:hypothetical protein PpBr36_03678 [Pyricularia pennisetigena]|uniref:hypothetical protein n=1 Tax=Pyricularia pennisetigena TaxID=1578925 RepID=UPI00115425D3|nr:hypothetical protein PpBr36_03678 [Pyricularia pennisetigena]TLS30524.1 hypothetical protein PpBr36_03678 [Pyricularia pennisetigena]
MCQTLRNTARRLAPVRSWQHLSRALSTSTPQASISTSIPQRTLRTARWTQDLSTPSRIPSTHPSAGQASRMLHTTAPRPARVSQQHQRGAQPPEEREAGTGGTDMGSLDVLADAPEPEFSISACLADGFRLANGTTVRDSGLLLVDGEAFSWRPWGDQAPSSPNLKLVNAKGQWELPNPEEALAVLGLVWPRPDLLLLGLGAEMRPLCPATRKFITALGIRVEVLDTRNAAAQFNLLATERGTRDVAAALIPAGFGRGV